MEWGLLGLFTGAVNVFTWSSNNVFICLGFYVAFNTVQVISQWVVGRTEEASTYSCSRFCTVNCRPTASNYQLSHLRLVQEPNPDLRGGRREYYHSATVAPGLQMNQVGLVNYFDFTLGPVMVDETQIFI